MKKILYITTVSSTINAFLIPHIEMLIKEGYTVDCAAYFNTEIDNKLKKIGVNIFNIPFNRNPLSYKNIKAFIELVKLQKENNYDIVHVHTPVASVYGRLLKIKFKNIKTIYTAHGFHFYKGSSKLNWIIYYTIEKIMALFTDIIITINNEDYERAKNFKIEKVEKINGVGINLEKYNLNQFNKQEIRKKLGFSDNDFIILMIAEVNKNKNHIQMINALEKLKYKNMKVICAGDGPLIDEIKNKITERGLDSTIKMLGFRSDIKELIIASDIGMLLSYREGLPKSIMEFMSFGKPVIGTNIRGINELIENKENGYLVEINDYNDTAEKIKILYENKTMRMYMRDFALEKIQKYDLDNILTELKQVYLSVDG